MKLSEYPRPPADSGRGIHWSPSQYQWGRKDWLKWQKRILELGFKWIKINVPPDYNAEALVKRLIDIEVMPVCRFISKNPTRLGGAVEKSIERLIALGARYFETNNEPDADVEWKGFRRPPHWEEIVIKNLVYDAHRIQSMGGFPAFVAFNPGPTESRNPIEILLDHPDGRQICEQGLWISLHNYGKGRPFNYPNDRVRMFGDPVTEEEWLDQGQPDFWTDAETIEFCWHNMAREQVNQLRAVQKNPNITIMQDKTCFRAYEYWHHLITAAGLDPLPIMMTEGGWETGDRLDPFYPEPTARRASELNLQMFKFIQGDADMTINRPDGSTISTPVPDYLFAVMPWHIGERAFGRDTSGQWEQGAWFTHWYDKKFGLNGELPIINMLRNLPPKTRTDGPVPPEWAKRQAVHPNVPEWDNRLIYLGDGIRVERAVVDTDAPKWEVISGLWQDKDELNPVRPLPQGYIMVKVLDENEKPITGAKVVVMRRSDSETVEDIIETKGWLDEFLGNYRMTATLGTYSLKVIHHDFPSDVIHNLGLGGEFPNSNFDTTSFLFSFKLSGKPPAEPATETPGIETPTETPSPPDTEPPTDTTETPPPPDTETPTDTAPTPIPTSDTPHNDAAGLGVKISPYTPAEICTVESIHHVTDADHLASGMLYADVVDENDRRVFNAVVLLKNQNGQRFRVLIEKPVSEPGGNMPLWPGNTYTVTGIELNDRQIPSDTVSGLQSTIPGHGDGHSFVVIFKLKRADST